MSDKKCKCHQENEEVKKHDHKCKCHESEHKCNCEEGDECGCGNNHSSKETEYLELAQRIKAEFDNYKKRNAEISRMSYENGVGTTILKMLPAIDSFNQAKSNITDPTVLSGIDLIYNQLMKAFEDLGVKKIESVGVLFDPNLHNAVLTDHNEKYGEDIILEEYQPGFIMGDKIIRHSVVKINK